jgi:quercetin dioxygenase-like cupin family protein
MDQATFKAGLKRDGYDEVALRQFPPGHDPGEHTHPYDVRALILEGEFTIAVDGQARTYRPGEMFSLAAGCRHTEHTGPAGVTFLAGRRQG